ncbi:PKD domain-containing protein [Algoriphagus machipongonensis]|uniref:PKD domain protein n=1 Tax=Algoriphagus machipongonensis TaxID=388413 RepID=A3HRE8_9BACT|nr:PKD domain-containing protein [Algoriphagus machipongonensis]EAZ82416.1 putative PKD domain protein [Algoriphagus machipongonensis]
MFFQEENKAMLLCIKVFLLCVFLFLSVKPSFSQTIPRAGFPYCEGFLNPQSDDPNNIRFTVAKGDKVNYGANSTVTFNPRDIKFTGNGIRLVESEDNLRGYLFVDLPFSPTYGIKTSFEYFIHTPSAYGLGDGFSFFLFDGDIDASTFEIGGVGGSLSYAPHGGNNSGNPFSGTYNYTSGGLKGGYLGIGFDVLGNFGNFQEKKFGGFHNPDQFNFSTPNDEIRFYPNAITIRGPVDPADLTRQNGNPPPIIDTTNPTYDSYQFVDGGIVNYDPSYTYPIPYIDDRAKNGSGDLYNNPTTKSEYFLPDSEMFNLGSNLVPSNFNCTTRPIGYRKVFIDLEPTNNPAVPYRISVYILKDNDPAPIKILDSVNYPYPIAADATLKLGFAASTGGSFYSAIDIRNVAALVSSVGDDKKPTPPELFKEICVEDQDQVEFPFCVTLADQNTFIQCIQLMDDFEAADNDFSDDFFNCEQPGFCNQRCLDGLKLLEVFDENNDLIGTFKADLSDNVNVGEFNEANIIFERNPASTFYGTITKYYKVVDNFGLESDAIPITITINPKPRIVFEGTPTDPTCGGQLDGSLIGVEIDRLSDDFIIEFYDGSGNPVNFTQTNLVEGADKYFTATYDLTGLDLGQIFVRATNPSSATLGPVCDVNNVPDPNPCLLEDELVYEFTQVRGTPVELNPYDDIICEGNDATVSPSVDPVFNPNGLDVPFRWYTDENGSNEILSGNATIDGTPVTVDIANDGTLTVTGLTADGLNPKTYSFYVETDFQDNGAGIGNFCPYVGTVTSIATFTVYPAIDIQIVETPDWCREGAGSIQVTAQGGTGNKEFFLYETGNASPIQQSGSIPADNYTFSGLLPGDYEVEVLTQNPNCTNLVSPITIEGPAESLSLTPGSITEEFCDLQNGALEFTLTGGNMPYNSISVGGVDINTLDFTQSGDTYSVTGLTGQTYSIEVVDAQGCPVSISMDVPKEDPSEFGTIPDEICEGQTATVQADIINQSSSTPTFNWFASDGAGGYQQITTGSNFDGGSFTFDAATNSMSVAGLAASNTPYTYYLQVTGPKVCDQSYLPVEILVNFGPEMDDPSLTMVTCFGGSDGTIQASIPSGIIADFEFSLLGDNGVDRPFAANNGLFEDLLPGNYTLTIRNAEGCFSTKDNLVISEPTEIQIQTVNTIDPTCGENNGVWNFTIADGTPDANGEYVISIDGTPLASLSADLTVNATNDFTISNLSPGIHTVSVTDDNGCPMEATVDLVAQPIPVFETNDVTICENDSFATLSPIIVDPAGSSPVFTWAYEDTANPGTYIDINNNDVINGATHTLVGDDLQIEGLSNADSPYQYFLKVSGNLVCPEAPIPAQVSVLKLPEVVFESEPTSCFEGNDGKISLISSDPDVNMTYTLVETGESNPTGNFVGLSAGTYTVVAQENGAPCDNQFTVEVTQPEELQLLNESKIDPTCDADNGSISFDIIGGTPEYEVEINGSSIDTFDHSVTGDTYEIKKLAPGTYSISILDANGCPLDRPDLFTLVNDAGIDVTIDPIAEEICEGQEVTLTPVFQATPPVTPTLNWYKDQALSESITSNATADADGLIYQISNGALTVSNLPAGDYTYYLEISGPGICTSVEEVLVTVYPELRADIVVTNETCFQASDGTITANPLGGNGNYEFSFNGSTFSNVNSWTDLAPGTYTISIRNDIGCTYTEDVEIVGPSAPIQVNTPSFIRSSCNLDNGSIEDLVITGGTPDYAIEWRKGSATGTVVPGDETGASNLAPDTYFLIVSDLAGCSETFTFEVEASSDPVYDIVPPINECSGSPVLIQPVHLAPDPSLPPAAATEVKWYKSAGQVDEISDGADAVNPDVVYTIDDSDWINPELTIEGLPAGQYTYYFFVVCTGQEIPVEIEVFDTPEVVFETSPETCFGDNNGKINLVSGDNPAYTYQLDSDSPGSLAELEARDFAPGTYSITIATPAGCAQVLTVEVEGPTAALEVEDLESINPGCGAANGKIESVISGGWAPYEVELFKDGASFSTQSVDGPDIKIDGLTIGEYYLTVTDAQGCLVTSTEVTLIDGPTQVLIDDVDICVGETATLFPSIDPDASPVTYEWFYDKAALNPIQVDGTPDSNGFSFNQTNSGALEISGMGSSSSPFTFYATVDGTSICPGFVGEATVTVYEVPTASASVVEEACFGENGQITISASGNSENYTYSLNGADPVSDPVFSVPPGIYEVEVITPASCNVLVENIEVKGPAAPIEALNVQVESPTCDLDIGLISFDVSGGYESYTVETFKNGNSIDVQTLAAPGVFSISNLGIGTYSFEISDIGGCVVTVDTPIELEEMPTIITANDENICEGETATLTPSVPSNISNPQFTWYFDENATQEISSGTQAGIDYQIDSNGELSVTGLLTSNSPTTYYVLAEGVGICGVSPKAVNVTISTIPNLKVSNPSIVCDPSGTVDLTDFIEGFNPNAYDYDVTSPSGVALRLDELEEVSQSGDYRVSSSLKGTSCWNAPQRIKVVIADSLLEADFQYEVDLGGGTVLTNGEIQIQEPVQFEDLTVGNAVIWNWDFGDGGSSSEQNPLHSYESKGTYTVTLTTIDSIGCQSEFQMVVNVFDDYNVMIPNAFTPDGQKNQYFKPYYRGIASMDFYIFNTWGELIYHATSLEDLGWDGTLNGSAVPNGNYVYRGTFVTRSGEKLDRSGVFVLIR